MRNLPSYEQWITEFKIDEMAIPSNKWVDWDLTKLDKEGLDVIWKMYTDTYAKQGMDFSADDSTELQHKYKATYLKDVDSDHIPDAFIIYKETKYGQKIALLGTNDKREAKSDLIKKVKELLHTRGWFIEASLKMEEILAASNVPVITDEEMIRDVVGNDKKPEFEEQGYYTRLLSKSSKRIRKRMYGITITKRLKLFEQFSEVKSVAIIGGGIAGLYCAYLLKKRRPDINFTILEKESELGGRVKMSEIDGVKVPTGAQFSRVKKDKTLQSLLKEFGISNKDYEMKMDYTFPEPDIDKMIKELKSNVKKFKREHHTFKEFAEEVLGKEKYNDFILAMGYTDFEKSDFIDTLENYGLDDNIPGYKAQDIDWSELISNLKKEIGSENIKLNYSVDKLEKRKNRFIINDDIEVDGVVFATTINVVRKFLKNKIYKDIESQSFLKAFAKVENIDCKNYTIVDIKLKKVIPLEGDVYTIAFCDNKTADELKEKPKSYFVELLNKRFKEAKVGEFKKFYWLEGTHYYKPLPNEYSSRNEFIKKAQHPEDNIWVCGEVVSDRQGWVDGALSSVEKISIFHQ